MVLVKEKFKEVEHIQSRNSDTGVPQSYQTYVIDKIYQDIQFPKLFFFALIRGSIS